MRYLLILIVLILLEACAHKNAHIEPTSKEFVKLSYKRFDQTLGKGWRALADLQHYLEAAKLIDRYIAYKKNFLRAWQSRNLAWHAGQMYAFAGDVNLARQRFFDSIDPHESKYTPILWNDYVRATLHSWTKIWIDSKNIESGFQKVLTLVESKPILM